MIICRTPFRISFFGGGTDYPAWYRQHGGAVLAHPIDKYCYLTCRYLPPFFEHRIRVVYSQDRELPDRRRDRASRRPRGASRTSEFERGVEMHHDGDLPARSGMGSSSAFTVGLLHALHALRGEHAQPRCSSREEAFTSSRTCSAKRSARRTRCWRPIGGLQPRPVPADGEIAVPVPRDPCPRAASPSCTAHLMLFYTGIARTASDVARSYAADLDAQGDASCASCGEMVEESIDILSSGMDLLRVRRAAARSLADQAQPERRDVSNPRGRRPLRRGAAAGRHRRQADRRGRRRLPAAVRAARTARGVRERCRGLLHVPFEFESAGSQIIFNDREQDYRGEEAARDRQSIEAFTELDERGASLL